VNLANLNLTEKNCFVAMKYYFLILNRTYLIILGETSLIGIVWNGLISAEGGGDEVTRLITKSLSVQGDLNNPFSYIKNDHISKVENLDLDGEDILLQNRANFKIRYDEITSVNYDPSKKWGMGYYPHDGKVYVKTSKGKKTEFIILGSQSGKSISDRILRQKQKS
jgi:hypothetical protein